MRYSLVAVDFLPPPVIGATLRKVAGRLSSGELRPLRHISHCLGNVAAAFRQMIQVGLVCALKWICCVRTLSGVVEQPQQRQAGWRVACHNAIFKATVPPCANFHLVPIPLQASHVGKVVVSTERFGSAPPAVQPRSCPSLAITGGSGEASA